MRILYFHQHFSTPAGSTGIRSYEMAQALLRAGHQVTMVCGRYSGGQTGLSGAFKRGRREGRVDGIDVIEFDLAYGNTDGFLKRSWTFAKFAFRSIGLTLRSDYDLAFATTTPLTAGVPGIAARWLRGKPFVFEVRDLWPELPRAMGVITNPIILSAMGVLEWMSYRSAHQCIGLAPGIVNGIVERGVLPERVHLVPNGSDIALFETNRSLRPAGVNDDDLMAIYAGTHGIANDLENVLKAAEVLKVRRRDDIKLVLLGRGLQKEALIASAAESGLDNVLFLHPVPKTELADFFAGADIGLQMLSNVPAFYFGTSPNKFFDYISAGLPVLNNYPGWVAEMIEAYDCGYAVPPDDPEAFADALEQAHQERALLPAKGKNALNLARRDFDRKRLSQRFVAVLEGTARAKSAWRPEIREEGEVS